MGKKAKRRRQQLASIKARRSETRAEGRASTRTRYRQKALDLLPSPGLPADKRDLLEQFDGHAGLRNALRDIAATREDWAGIPMPLDGERLVIEPTYPGAAGLASIGAPAPREPDPEYDQAKVRNRWYSMQRRCDIMVWDNQGKIQWGVVPGIHHFEKDLRTLGCQETWGIEQEGNAIDLFCRLVSHRQFKQYLMTGMFLESSKRSNVMYCFRRLRPTLALNMRGKDVRIMCALCLHPIAYYAGSWAGAMCPTDDVIAHLQMMRGDEKMYWRRANQHPAWRPEAGL